jgi:hypothetical protein
LGRVRQERGSYAIKLKIGVLRGKRKELADMYGPPREGRPGTEKGKEETENERVSYTAYLEDNTLQRART